VVTRTNFFNRPFNDVSWQLLDQVDDLGLESLKIAISEQDDHTRELEVKVAAPTLILRVFSRSNQIREQDLKDLTECEKPWVLLSLGVRRGRLLDSLNVEKFENVANAFAHRVAQDLVLALDHATLEHLSKASVLQNCEWLNNLDGKNLIDEVEEMREDVGLLSESLHDADELLFVIRVAIVFVIYLL